MSYIFKNIMTDFSSHFFTLQIEISGYIKKIVFGHFTNKRIHHIHQWKRVVSFGISKYLPFLEIIYLHDIMGQSNVFF